MKILLYPLLAALIFSAPSNTVEKKPTDKTPTCFGRNPCNACKTCNYCNFCNSGGTCGICIPVKKKVEPEKNKNPDKQPASTGQCKAITKKGTRCSRSSRSIGYCWQHGG